jgi:hypothetical protein
MIVSSEECSRFSALTQKLTNKENTERSRRAGTNARTRGSHPMFFFFSNGLGIAGSIVVSVVVTLAPLYACSGP